MKLSRIAIIAMTTWLLAGCQSAEPSKRDEADKRLPTDTVVPLPPNHILPDSILATFLSSSTPRIYSLNEVTKMTTDSVGIMEMTQGDTTVSFIDLDSGLSARFFFKSIGEDSLLIAPGLIINQKEIPIEKSRMEQHAPAIGTPSASVATSPSATRWVSAIDTAGIIYCIAF